MDMSARTTGLLLLCLSVAAEADVGPACKSHADCGFNGKCTGGTCATLVPHSGNGAKANATASSKAGGMIGEDPFLYRDPRCGKCLF
jgi:hypothetical protein